MRILIASDRIPPEHAGGAEIVAWRLAVGLQRAGHEVHVVAATDDEPFEVVREGIPTYHLHSRYPARFQAYLALYNPQTVPALRRLLRRLEPDVFNAHNVHNALSYHSLTIAHRLGIPTVFSAHDPTPVVYTKLQHFIDPTIDGAPPHEAYRLPRWYNLRQMRFRYNPLRNITIRRVLARRAHRRTTPSAELARVFEANGLPPFTPVHNGINVEAFASPPAAAIEALRERLALTGRKVILFAGRLSEAKGVRVAIQALDALVQRVPEALLLALSARSIGKHAPPHLAEHIRSGGWLLGDELVAAYHLADVAIVPTITFEPFGMICIEAMAAGTPVIATCFGGPPEVVIDGETGYIVNPFKTEQFAAKLEALLTNDARRAQMGEAGRARVRAHFTLRRQVRQMEAIYREAVDEAVHPRLVP
jgi:glycosyltransferase involved in cell wall biosynthesis